MSKHFRPWKIDEAQLLPPSVQDYVPEGHLSRFIVAVVRESLDLSEIEASYASVLGQPPFHPALMTALLLNGYVSGIYSSRRIAKAWRETRRTSAPSPTSASGICRRWRGCSSRS
jgi:transposase